MGTAEQVTTTCTLCCKVVVLKLGNGTKISKLYRKAFPDAVGFDILAPQCCKCGCVACEACLPQELAHTVPEHVLRALGFAIGNLPTKKGTQRGMCVVTVSSCTHMVCAVALVSAIPRTKTTLCQVDQPERITNGVTIQSGLTVDAPFVEGNVIQRLGQPITEVKSLQIMQKRDQKMWQPHLTKPKPACGKSTTVWLLSIVQNC
jgi:hypothetical protein